MPNETPKPRRFDLHPDQFIAGIAGQLDVAEAASYSYLVLQNYSKRGPVPVEIVIGLFGRSVDPRTIKAAMERLIAKGKVSRCGGDLLANGVRDEVEKATIRMRTYVENGSKGGRHARDLNAEINNNSSLSEPGGCLAGRVTAPPLPLPLPIQKEEESPQSPPKGASTRGHRLSKDWKISQHLIEYAQSLGLVNGLCDRFVEEFTGWAWTSPKAVKIDWDLTAMTFMRRKAEEWETNKPVGRKGLYGGAMK